MSYSIYLQSTRSQYDYSDNSVNITLSLPFSWNDNHNMIVSSSQITHDQHSGDSYSTGISGTLLDDNRPSYGVNTGYQQSGSQTASANLGYQGSKGNINSSYSYSRDYSQKTLDVSGGIVAHSGGITLSQPLGNTFALVHADNANGVGVLNAPGVKIDHFGYAVVNNISPYRYNSVALDTEELSTGLDIPQSIVQTVPTEKAIVRVNFDTYYGYSLLIHSHLKDRTYPQIGSVVFNSTQRNSGTVGMNGDMYVSGVKAGEVITVKWGEESLSQCTIKIPRDLPVQTEGQGYLEASLLCEQ
ncbi:fimbrial biogenesis outer membrane usher protein [Escherichia coli]